MLYSKYPIIAGNTPYAYMFFSEGPRGNIRKGVFYNQIGENLFNLGFGDLSDDFMKFNDFSRSNNGDRDMVLATVAQTAISFTDEFPNARIFVEGSTSARTRLYQMGIAANLNDINEIFVIQGYLNKDWQPFQRGINYEAFLVYRKILF